MATREQKHLSSRRTARCRRDVSSDRRVSRVDMPRVPWGPTHELRGPYIRRSKEIKPGREQKKLRVIPPLYERHANMATRERKHPSSRRMAHSCRKTASAIALRRRTDPAAHDRSGEHSVYDRDRMMSAHPGDRQGFDIALFRASCRSSDLVHCVICGSMLDHHDRLSRVCRGECHRIAHTVRSENHEVTRESAAVRGYCDRCLYPSGSHGKGCRFAMLEYQDWRCSICGEPLDPSLTMPHPRAITRDHYIPRSHGGARIENNIFLAHRACNARKASSMPPSQNRT